MAQGITGYFDLVNSRYGLTLRVHYSQTYEISTNKSVVAISKLQVASSSNSGLLRYLNGSVSVDGTTAVSMSSSSGTHSIYVNNKNTFYDVTGALGSVSVTHNSDGSKNVTISASINFIRDTGASAESISGSQTIALTTIPRSSSFTVSNGTLGVAQTIKVTRQSTSFSHTITYKCGVASGTVCDKSTSESISFTPPVDLAAQNTTGTSLTMTITLQTYSGSTAVGSAVSNAVSMAIPASVKPDCNLSYMDSTGYSDRFGGYVQGQSRLLIGLVGTPAYGSPIASYKTVVDGKTYTTSSFTTDTLNKSGTLSATVTDKRGRTSDPKTVELNVLPYSKPKITSFNVHRCNADGTKNDTGSYAKVTYSHEITSLSEKNTKTITLKYKKSTDKSFISVPMQSVYTSENTEYIFEADDGSSYDVSLTVADYFATQTRTTSVSTASVIMHFRADGTGMGIGKVSEKVNTLDVGWDIELNGHNLLNDGAVPFAPAGYGLGATPKDITAAELDTTTSNGWYRLANQSITVGGYTYPDWYIHVVKYSNSYLVQEMHTLNGYKVVRVCNNGTWYDEWENPPMEAGVEYRTTERYKGKSVYRKLITYTNDSKIGSTSGVTSTSVPHNISGFSKLVRITGKQNGNMLPYLTTSGAMTFVSTVTAKNVFIDTLNIEWASREWEFDIAYVKD